MAEKSIFWTTGSTGDGTSAYTQAELFSFFSRTLLANPASQGVIASYGNALVCAGGASSPLTVNSGAALVNGIPYINDSTKSLAITTPTTGATGFAIILRADYTAQTVRLVVKSSADGTAAIPSMTQSGSIWEIPLYSSTIATSGVITNPLTDKRAYINPEINSYYNAVGLIVDSLQTSLTTNFFASGVTAYTFAKPFKTGTTPIVLINSISAGLNTSNLSVSSVTNTGFSINNASASTITTCVMALGLL